jgi:hypothetical protein
MNKTNKTNKTTTKAALTTKAKGKKVVTPGMFASSIALFKQSVEKVKSGVAGAFATGVACFTFVVGLGVKAIAAALAVAVLFIGLGVAVGVAQADKPVSATEKAQVEAKRLSDATAALQAGMPAPAKPGVLTRISNWDKGAREYAFGTSKKSAPVADAPKAAELKIAVAAK